MQVIQTVKSMNVLINIILFIQLSLPKLLHCLVNVSISLSVAVSQSKFHQWVPLLSYFSLISRVFFPKFNPLFITFVTQMLSRSGGSTGGQVPVGALHFYSMSVYSVFCVLLVLHIYKPEIIMQSRYSILGFCMILSFLILY